MNNGDDCVVIMEAEDLPLFQNGLKRWFEIHGYRMAVEEPVYELEKIEFCQSRVVLRGEDALMVRNLTNSFTKDPMCLVPLQTSNVLQMWYRAVGDCGAAITSGMPVLQEYYRMYQRSGRDYTEGFLQHVQKNTSHLTRMKGITQIERVVTAESRCSFYYAFGILPEYQIVLERLFATMSLSGNIEELMHQDLTVDKYDNCPPSAVQWMF